MDNFNQEIIKVLELLAYKHKQFEIKIKDGNWFNGIFDENGEQASFSIYEDDLEPIGMNRYGFCSVLQHLEKDESISVEYVHDPNTFNMENIEIKDIENDIARIPLFSITVPDTIYGTLRYYKDGGKSQKIIGKPKFDSEKSILIVNDKEVKIKQKNDKPNSHYVLEYVFENKEGLIVQSFYTDIIAEKFEGDDLKWRSLYRACNDINKKVSEQANVGKFLIIKSGISGYVQINPDYL